MPFTPDVIAATLHAPPVHVERNWPLVVEALADLKILDPATEVAAIATIGTEGYTFTPERQPGTDGYFRRMYEFKRALGNTESGDGARYCGRGFLPILGRSEYAQYGKLIGVDLVADPELALEPAHAARILAYAFMLKEVPKAANADDWVKVRRLVNGNLDGWKRFSAIVSALLKLQPDRG